MLRMESRRNSPRKKVTPRVGERIVEDELGRRSPMGSTTETQMWRQGEEHVATDRQTIDAVSDGACLAGVVTRTGAVTTIAIKQAAKELARSVSGTHAVDDDARARRRGECS